MLYSRNAYDWTFRLAAIAAAAELIKAKSFTIDGEAAVLGHDGLSRFEELSHREAARDFPIIYSISRSAPSARRAGGIANLNPDAARAGSIGTVNPLGNDTLSAKMTSVRKDGGAIFGNVFVKQDASLNIAQQTCQSCLAFEKRKTAQILAITLDQVEGVEDCDAEAIAIASRADT